MKNTQEPHNDFKINNNINLHHTSWVKLHPHFSLNANGSAMTPSIYFLLNFHNTSSVHDFVNDSSNEVSVYFLQKMVCFV